MLTYLQAQIRTKKTHIFDLKEVLCEYGKWNGMEMGQILEMEIERDGNGICSLVWDETGAKILSHVDL